MLMVNFQFHSFQFSFVGVTNFFCSSLSLIAQLVSMFSQFEHEFKHHKMCRSVEVWILTRARLNGFFCATLQPSIGWFSHWKAEFRSIFQLVERNLTSVRHKRWMERKNMIELHSWNWQRFFLTHPLTDEISHASAARRDKTSASKIDPK